MSKIVMPINEEEYKRDCRNCYHQGREDAIDEMKQWLYKNKDVNYSNMLCFLDDLEQLKEKTKCKQEQM